MPLLLIVLTIYALADRAWRRVRMTHSRHGTRVFDAQRFALWLALSSAIGFALGLNGFGAGLTALSVAIGAGFLRSMPGAGLLYGGLAAVVVLILNAIVVGAEAGNPALVAIARALDDLVQEDVERFLLLWLLFPLLNAVFDTLSWRLSRRLGLALQVGSHAPRRITVPKGGSVPTRGTFADAGRLLDKRLVLGPSRSRHRAVAATRRGRRRGCLVGTVRLLQARAQRLLCAGRCDGRLRFGSVGSGILAYRHARHHARADGTAPDGGRFGHGECFGTACRAGCSTLCHPDVRSGTPVVRSRQPASCLAAPGARDPHDGTGECLGDAARLAGGECTEQRLSCCSCWAIPFRLGNSSPRS